MIPTREMLSLLCKGSGVKNKNYARGSNRHAYKACKDPAPNSPCAPEIHGTGSLAWIHRPGCQDQYRLNGSRLQSYWGVSQNQEYHFKDPIIIRAIVYWGTLILENYH